MSQLNNPPSAANSAIQNVIQQGYCIGCGACRVHDPRIQITQTPLGTYQADLSAIPITTNPPHNPNDQAPQESLSQICPFAATRNETDIANSLYPNAPHFHSSAGRYQAIYTGHVNHPQQRANSSSGGLTTWLLTQLMQQDQIDAVVHASSSTQPGILFQYRLSTSIQDIQQGAKSKYYPTTYADIITQVKQQNLRIAFVGVPCFVKSIRLLCETDPILNQAVKYCISLFCGHQKSTGFAQMLAWQQGVHPNDLSAIDFRVKTNQKAHQYAVQVGTSKQSPPTGAQPQTYKPAAIRTLIGQDWGLGYFKLKSCDWCDDIAAETADITLGDAWLPQYQNNPAGHNILIVRHPKLLALLQQGQQTQQLTLNPENVATVYQSQAASYRHRQQGLDIRQRHAQQTQQWHPTKRIKAHQYSVTNTQIKLYQMRQTLAQQSHQTFAAAKAKNSFSFFIIKMLPIQLKYYAINKQLTKQILVISYQLAHYLARKLKK